MFKSNCEIRSFNKMPGVISDHLKDSSLAINKKTTYFLKNLHNKQTPFFLSLKINSNSFTFFHKNTFVFFIVTAYNIQRKDKNKKLTLSINLQIRLRNKILIIVSKKCFYKIMYDHNTKIQKMHNISPRDSKYDPRSITYLTLLSHRVTLHKIATDQSHSITLPT